MLNSNKVGIEFYQNLGKLFYAIAMTDRTVHIKELDKLREIIRKSWLAVDDIEDRCNADAAYQIETVFDRLLENDGESEQCFEDFAKYYTEHLKLFPEQVKILIADTAHSIAKSFSGTNKAELIILAKLALLLRD
ncbi:hypothetical protein [Zobellia nedashkovskayae]|uniref:hypothetical protein n=1 Tax=Zobellia nedashkovskayae TaxID=2779510 RepID=UPI001889E7AF|nr:hypothetical protein [Zobellia nedashkovskayae]